MMNSMRKWLFKLLKLSLWVCVFVSIYLRTTVLSVGYEYDEIFTAVSTDPSLPFSWIYTNYLLPDVHPPLYNALVWIWNHIAPYGPEFWLHIPSLILGISALVVAWSFFPKRFGKWTRLLFVSLLSCNVYTVVYSQHARSYMLILLLSVILTYLFVHIAHATRRNISVSRKTWVCFAVTSFLLCWTHYFGALLFGVFSVILALQAWCYKRKMLCFLLVPCLVFAGFLPWLIPNFIAQISLDRFGGNWWANQMPSWHTYTCIIVFWAASLRGALLLLTLLAAALLCRFLPLRNPIRFFPFRETVLLLLALVLFIACVALVSTKTYMFIPRYFIVLLPLVYFPLSLYFAPLLRRFPLLGIILIVFFAFSMDNFNYQRNMLLLKSEYDIPSRKIAQIFRDRYADKEMFVIAMEAFPPQSMPAMYGFYVNKIYKLNMPVYELFFMEEAKREALLARQEDAVIWMPNCTQDKLSRISLEWKKIVYTYDHVGFVCFLRLEDEK